jgi:hypothetical protein
MKKPGQWTVPASFSYFWSLSERRRISLKHADSISEFLTDGQPIGH